jgi:hypothetical protein
MDVDEFTEFTIDNISKYLNYNKQLLIGMNLSLDSHEISKSLTSSLNRFLIGNKTKISDLYDSLLNNFEEITNKQTIIENQIKQFNTEQKFNYFIDIDNIIILVFYKQFIYIKKLILQIENAIKSNINLVFINFFLISKLYDEPEKVSSNYIYILRKMLENSKSNYDISNEHSSRLKDFLNINSLDIISNIINVIFKLDVDFQKIIDELKNEKIEEYKKINIVEYSDSYKEIESEFKNEFKNEPSNKSEGNDKPQDPPIEIFNKIEKKYEKKKNYILLQKRNIQIESLLNADNIDLILNSSTTIELWHSFNLFIYKRFNFDFNIYSGKINDLINQKQFDLIYLINLDFINDLDIPDASLTLPGSLIPSIFGGSLLDSTNINNETDSYYSKYIKYKQKYIKLKYKYK